MPAILRDGPRRRRFAGGDGIAFLASFTDGSQGVYVATVPEPGTALLLGLGLCALRIARSRAA